MRPRRPHSPVRPPEPAQRRHRRLLLVVPAVVAGGLLLGPAGAVASATGSSPAASAEPVQVVGGGTFSLRPGRVATTGWGVAPGVAATAVRVPALAAGGPLWFAVELAETATTPGYRGRVRISADGEMQVSATSLVRGSETFSQGPVLPSRAPAGSLVHLEVRALPDSRSGVEVRTWVDGHDVPDWQYGLLDPAGAMAAPTEARVWTRLSASVNQSVTFGHRGIRAVTPVPEATTAEQVDPDATLDLPVGGVDCSLWVEAAGPTTTSFTVPALSAPLWLSLEMPGAEEGTTYRGRVKVNPSGALQLSTTRASAVDLDATAYGPVLDQRAGQGARVTLEVNPRPAAEGQEKALELRAWLAGTPVPQWQQVYTDPGLAEEVTTTRVHAQLSGSAEEGVSLRHSLPESSALVGPTP
ncbi:hypothetical protein [Pseudokineococcus sp. 1T1Z-3]|uniref:hypothetical protein n=1 Tax=Pseudokineococcus sp. 1T1Z-3 TaxID=3132745 RepID=UPI0030A1E995